MHKNMHEDIEEGKVVPHLWSCNVERRVGQFKPLLRFLPGQSSRLLDLLELVCKLQDKGQK